SRARLIRSPVYPGAWSRGGTLLSARPWSWFPRSCGPVLLSGAAPHASHVVVAEQTRSSGGLNYAPSENRVLAAAERASVTGVQRVRLTHREQAPTLYLFLEA